jgi:hypothetical protein
MVLMMGSRAVKPAGKESDPATSMDAIAVTNASSPFVPQRATTSRFHRFAPSAETVMTGHHFRWSAAIASSSSGPIIISPGTVNAVSCQRAHNVPVSRLPDSTVDDHDQPLLRSVLHHPAIDGRVDPGIPRLGVVNALPWPVGWGRRALRRWNGMSRRRAGRIPRRWWRRYGDDVKEPPPGSPGLWNSASGGFKLGANLAMDRVELLRVINGWALPTTAIVAGLATALDSVVRFLERLAEETRNDLAAKMSRPHKKRGRTSLAPPPKPRVGPIVFCGRIALGPTTRFNFFMSLLIGLPVSAIPLVRRDGLLHRRGHAYRPGLPGGFIVAFKLGYRPDTGT